MVEMTSKPNLGSDYPSDWKQLFVGDLISITTGSRNTQDNNPEGLFPFFVRSQKVERIDGYSFDKEAVLTSGDGVGTGKIFHYINGKFDAHQRVYVLSNFVDELHGKYFYWQFSNLFFDRIMSMTAKSSVDSVRQEMITRMSFPLPFIKEQQAIAEALSDADALIVSLEKLIEKKSLIGKELRRRLIPESLGNITAGTFVEATIDELVDCLDNERIPLNNAQRSKMRGDIPYCGANGILDYIDQYIFDEDIILLAEDGGHFDEFETRPIAYQITGKCWVNNHAHILRAKQPILNDYIFHALVHKDITRFLASGTRAKLNKSELLKITILVPRNANEANRISQILNDTNDEITSLISKLNKAKKVKAGMMQELLTGRTRLV